MSFKLHGFVASPSSGRRGLHALSTSYRPLSSASVPTPRWRPSGPVLIPSATATAVPPRPAAEATRPAADEGVHMVPHQWLRAATTYGDLPALIDPHRKPPIHLSFKQASHLMTDFAAGLHWLGLREGDHVSLFAENSSRWIIADQGIQMVGAADAVRGCTAPVDELMYILQHSDSCALVVQDVKALTRLVPHLTEHTAPSLKFIIILWTESSEEAVTPPEVRDAVPGVPVLTFLAVVAQGTVARDQFGMPRLTAGHLATLVYTSGTTGHPKGVMLTHGNLQYQVDSLDHFIDVRPGERTISLLPPWHIYERSSSNYILSRGAAQVYSSVLKLRDDLPHFTPDYMVCVPLVLDALHSRITHKLRSMPPPRRLVAEFLLSVSLTFVTWRRVLEGRALRLACAGRGVVTWLRAAVTCALLLPLHKLADRLVHSTIRQSLGIRRTVISGGSSMPPPLDDFFEAIGVEVVNGWGMTETSPVLACRRTSRNIRGSVGDVMPGTQLRVVDPNSLEDVPDGTQGLVLARGPGVMKGYYGDEAATAKAFRAGDGWLDTGDLGWRAPQGVTGSDMGGAVVLTGRAKDTIVLSNGNNVEPQVIEDAIQRSPLIKFCVLVGQDKRALGALVFVDEEAVEHSGVGDVEKAVVAEVNKYNRQRHGYSDWEHVGAVALAKFPLSVENGTLTKTMKPRRKEIMQVHHEEVETILHRLR